MELFQMENFQLVIHPSCLAIDVFKNIINRDKSKNKQRALAELSFVYFYTDFKSDFNNILDDEIKIDEIKKAIGESVLPNKWQPDNLVMEAINFYRERQKTISMVLLEDARLAAKKVSDYYKTVNLNERDMKTGKLVNNPKQVLDSIKAVPDTIKSLKKVEDEIKKEIQTQSSARGSVEKNIFEDGGI